MSSKIAAKKRYQVNFIALLFGKEETPNTLF